MKEESGMALRSGLLSVLCETMNGQRCPRLFAACSSLVVLIVNGVKIGRRHCPTDLLPCLLTMLDNDDVDIQNGATQAIGMMCRGGESGVWMDGVLNSGVVERVCDGVCSEKNQKVVIGMVRVLDSLCFGMKKQITVLRKEEKRRMGERQKEGEERTLSKEETEREGGMEEEDEWSGSEFSLMSRCLSGLGLIEETLGRVLRGLMDEDEEEEDEKMDDGEEERREENGKEDEMERRELEKEVGGMFVRHFGRSVSQRVGKIGVIGIDIGKERFWMKKREEDRTRKNEEKLKHELDEMRRKEEDRQRRMDEMEKEHRQTQAELKQQYEENKLKIKLAEEYKQLKLVEEVERMRREEKEEEEEEERKRQTKTGASAIEWFDSSKFTLSGSAFLSQSNHNLLSAAFGPVVVRFTLVIKVKSGCYKLGVASVAQTDQLKSSDRFRDIPQTAGWCVTHCECTQNSKETHRGTACKAGVVGQRVVLEADGREGKRALKLSQDGQTQPTFFSNIPVPFRFVVRLNGASVEIESVEVVKAPLMVGGSIDVRMD
ncbi:hypothetical protein BLNAU_9068 [Blattamonas nauphoetae]|uniref:Uncharacterized protein n=1 Tax=Blattamonas nauphoetae TaxID=2049346 RepID=A0ABQ9XWQ2_9EUKA|nr:hypothetical protein BLNAU_9068 [Blattamonas nauphoetae]